MYRIVFLDIDGTILNSNDEFDEKLIQAIQELQQRNVIVCLASGRSLDGSIIYGQKFGCSHYIVYNGGYVVSNNTIIQDEKIPANVAFSLCKKTNNFNGTYVHFSGRSARSNHPPVGVEYLLPEANPSNVIDTNSDAHRLALYLDEAHRALLKEEINDAACFDEGDRLEVFPSGSKWTGISALINELGIAPDEVVTIGNGTNDIEMLAAAGLGIAMGNSPDSVKKAADWVTQDNNHHGVLLALQKVFNLNNILVI